MARWVKLRTGIVEHIESGRMTADEYVVYSMLILRADWRTGIWFGSAGHLGKILHWSARRCQKLLKSLREKKYISGECPRPSRSAYSIRVERYFPQISTGGCVCTDAGVRPQGRRGASVGATSVEVIQEEKQKKKPAQVQRGSFSVSQQDQKRKAKQKRLGKEAGVSSELYVGSGPACSIPEVWNAIQELGRRKTLP